MSFVEVWHSSWGRAVQALPWLLVAHRVEEAWQTFSPGLGWGCLGCGAGSVLTHLWEEDGPGTFCATLPSILLDRLEVCRGTRRDLVWGHRLSEEVPAGSLCRQWPTPLGPFLAKQETRKRFLSLALLVQTQR